MTELRPSTIINVLINMKNNAKADTTINAARKALQVLEKHANLQDPETVKHFIAHHPVSKSYKHNLCISYWRYCKYYQIPFDMPRYYADEKDIIPPKKDKLLMIIAQAGKVLGTKLQLSIETGLRPIELMNLKVKEIHADDRLVQPETHKHGQGRILKISTELVTRIQEHVIKNHLKPDDKLFKGTSETYSYKYRTLRNKLADKLKDPTIRQIRLYDFRHYFCTKKLYDLKNPFIVMKLMGHKKLTTTQKYMHLINLNDDEYICQGATNLQQAQTLIESGFEYVTEIDGTKLFRKRK